MRLPSRLFIFSLLAALLFVSGCSSSGSKKGEGEEGLSEADLAAQREGRFGSGSIPTAEGEGLFRDVHFSYDSYQISEAARMDIEANAEVLRSNPSWSVQIEGHTDDRGTAEYNLALGEQRAGAVKNVLSSLGISGGRISTISYGEEVPLEQGSSESAFARNRRAHFSPSGR